MLANVVLCGVLLYMESHTLHGVANQVQATTKQIQAKQEDALQLVRDKQVEAARAALRTKANSLVRVLGQLSATPLLRLETEALDKYRQQICSDPDVVFAYVTDTEEEAVSTCTNTSDSHVRPRR